MVGPVVLMGSFLCIVQCSFFFFFKQKTAYEMATRLEFRRVLFRSTTRCSRSSSERCELRAIPAPTSAWRRSCWSITAPLSADGATDAVRGAAASRYGELRSRIGARTDCAGRVPADHRTATTEGGAMRKILIATDGSPAAVEAVEFGLELAAEHGAEAIFVHVAPAVDVIPLAGFGMTGSLPHELNDVDRAPLDAAVALADEHGVVAT